jgi:hypothetical protein
MNNHVWFDGIGWAGTVALLVAYAMVSLRNWKEIQQLTNFSMSSAAFSWPQTPSFIELTLLLL